MSIHAHTATRVARGAAVALAVGFGTFAAVAGIPVEIGDAVFGGALLLGGTLFGTFIVRRTGNPIGWLFVATPVAVAVSIVTESYVIGAFRPEPRDLPFVRGFAWLNGISSVAFPAPIPLLLLLFPTGRPRSPRWRWAVRLWAAGLAGALLWTAFRAGEIFGIPGSGDPPSGYFTNPVPLHFPHPIERGLLWLGVVGLAGSGFLGVVSLLLRFRTARGIERQQLRWIALVGLLVLLLFGTMLGFDVLGVDTEGGYEDVVWVGTLLLLLVGLPVAVAIAILKYRLYDVDVVIRKTVVYAILAAFITLVYVAIVVGLGSLFAGDLALSVAATAVVAVAFQPVRERANRLANRLVYGKRATPYEVLARFSQRVRGTYAAEDVLPRTARIIAEGIGAERIEIWLRIGQAWRRSATWPADDGEATLPARGDEPPAPDEVDRTVPVRYRGELLAAVAVRKPASEPLTPAESRLLDDLAGQAGLVLSNARLTAELRARLDEISARAAELRASRQRIVATQDEERRRLERNIHDGAQQHLVALAVKLRLARSLLEREPARAATTLREIRGQVEAAAETLGALALGIYPPVLEERGLVEALRAQADMGAVPVRIEDGGVGRLPIEVEAAAYFVCLEALQNAAKYADASQIVVRLAREDGELRFEVADDGSGFEPSSNGGGTGLAGMRDRLAVLGGDATVESAPQRGTTVRGRVPIAEGPP